MVQWLKDNVALCTWCAGSITVLTFFLNFVFKKIKQGGAPSQKVEHIHGSVVNQAGGNVTIGTTGRNDVEQGNSEDK